MQYLVSICQIPFWLHAIKGKNQKRKRKKKEKQNFFCVKKKAEYSKIKKGKNLIELLKAKGEDL